MSTENENRNWMVQFRTGARMGRLRRKWSRQCRECWSCFGSSSPPSSSWLLFCCGPSSLPMRSRTMVWCCSPRSCLLLVIAMAAPEWCPIWLSARRRGDSLPMWLVTRPRSSLPLRSFPVSSASSSLIVEFATVCWECVREVWMTKGVLSYHPVQPTVLSL